MDIFPSAELEGITHFFINKKRTSIEHAFAYLKESKIESFKKLELKNYKLNSCHDLSAENILDNVYHNFNSLMPEKGRKILDVGYGLNTKIMEYFSSKGYEVSGIDIIKLPDKHEEEHYNNPASINGVNKLMKTQGSVDYLGVINCTKRYWGYFLDWDIADKQSMIYFWGSWSSRSQNITIGQTSRNYFYNDDFEIKSFNSDERRAELEYLIKKETLKKAKQSLENNGKLMVVNPAFTKLGAGYLSPNDELIDYIELLKLLSETGYKKISAIGDFSNNSYFSDIFKKNEINKPVILIAE